MNDDGIVIHKQGSWDWLDWGDNADCAVMENAWYYMALSSCVKMAQLLGCNNDVSLYNARMDSIKNNFNRLFWKNGYYYNRTENGKPDDRANALACLSRLADKNKYTGILNVLKSTENASPYMEKYVLDALCEMGEIDEAVKRMKRRYKEMVDYHYSTLWEYWNTDGTLNHAWSGGPLITMSKYIAGIRPLDTAYSRFEIKPHLGELNYIKCAVPSIKGKIEVEIRRNNEAVSMNVTIPENTVAEVYLPIINNSIKINSPHEFIFENGYAKFVLSCGTYML
jgi:hypothetical protein